VKLIVEVTKKYIIKNNKVMIYLKMVTKKLDKYIENKNLEVNVLKNTTSRNVLKNIKSY